MSDTIKLMRIMKVKFVLSFLITAIIFSVNGDHYLEDCLSEKGIKSDEVQILARIDDPRLHCIQACILERKGILVDGSIDKVIAKSQLSHFINEFGDETTDRMLNICTEGLSSLEKCEVANRLTDCVVKTMRDLAGMKTKKL